MDPAPGKYQADTRVSQKKKTRSQRGRRRRLTGPWKPTAFGSRPKALPSDQLERFQRLDARGGPVRTEDGEEMDTGTSDQCDQEMGTDQ